MSLPQFERSVSLSHHTTFRIGGPATAFLVVRNPDEVVQATWKASGMGLPWHVIGHGSNLLVSDKGFDGAVIVFKDDTPPHRNADGTVVASGGYALGELVAFMAEGGIAGLEDLAGIPGTVGGALCGNAGAYGTAIGDRLKSILLLDRDGGMRRAAASDLRLAYRSSALKESGEVVLEATFHAARGDPDRLRRHVEERLADRRQKHPDPLRVATAGSFFKNPTASDGRRIAAGRLLEDAGCKELAVGGARVWPAHANIIVAEGAAQAAHVGELAARMSARVAEQHGITLVPEVVYFE